MNDRWLIGVLVFFFLAYIFGTYSFGEDLWLFTQMALITSLTITASLMVLLVFYYRTKSIEFTYSYVLLSFSMISYCIAEVLWGYFDSIKVETYPSIAEIFYTFYFIGGILFCITFVWNKRKYTPNYIKIISVSVGSMMFLLYLVLSLDSLDIFMNHVNTFNIWNLSLFWVSTIMVIQSFTLVTVAVAATLKISKNPRLRVVWILFGMAFIGNGIADIFYYSDANKELFEYTDWTNIMWFGTVLLVFYGGFIHRYLYKKL